MTSDPRQRLDDTIDTITARLNDPNDPWNAYSAETRAAITASVDEAIRHRPFLSDFECGLACWSLDVLARKPGPREGPDRPAMTDLG